MIEQVIWVTAVRDYSSKAAKAAAAAVKGEPVRDAALVEFWPVEAGPVHRWPQRASVAFGEVSAVNQMFPRSFALYRAWGVLDQGADGNSRFTPLRAEYLEEFDFSSVLSGVVAPERLTKVG